MFDLQPCLTHSSSLEPTLAPVAVERTMTTRAAALVLILNSNITSSMCPFLSNFLCYLNYSRVLVEVNIWDAYLNFPCFFCSLCFHLLLQ